MKGARNGLSGKCGIQKHGFKNWTTPTTPTGSTRNWAQFNPVKTLKTSENW